MFAEPLARRIWAAGPSPDLRTTLGPQPVRVHHRGPWNRCVATYLDPLVPPEHACREPPLADHPPSWPAANGRRCMMNLYSSQHYSPPATAPSICSTASSRYHSPPPMTPMRYAQTAANPSREISYRRAVRAPRGVSGGVSGGVPGGVSGPAPSSAQAAAQGTFSAARRGAARPAHRPAPAPQPAAPAAAPGARWTDSPHA